MSSTLESVSTPPFEVPSRFSREPNYEPLALASEEDEFVNTAESDELSVPHVGVWKTLVSQTNWEKGAIILRWRESLQAAGLPAAAYSDWQWAKRAGNVTPQHVGRLRRVAERFGEQAKKYPKLFWSHFYATLDWEDAELWLEGAVQNDWSVAQMQVRRADTLGASADLKPRDEDVYSAEWDEDVSGRNDSSVNRSANRIEPKTAEIGAADISEGFDADMPLGMDAKPEKPAKNKNGEQDGKASGGRTTKDLMIALADFSDMPEDLAEALEALKTSLLNHKLSSWNEVSTQKLSQHLDAMKALLTSAD
jgi:hypothetical protein